MKRALLLSAVLGLLAPVALVGCGGEESSVTKEETIKTPDGTKTITDEKKIENTGDMKETP